MINENFVLLGVLLQFLGGSSYLLLTLKGKVKPNRITWVLWALAPMIAFAAEIKQGVGIKSLVTFMAGFMPMLILIASFISKKSQWKLGMLDFVCGTLSFLGLILWIATGVGNIAIFFGILADGLAGFPTLVKAYFFPETESYFIYTCGAISSSIALLTITNWNFANFGFPLYLVIFNITCASLIWFKVGKRLT